MKEEISLFKIIDRMNDIEQHGELISSMQKDEVKIFFSKYFTNNSSYLGFQFSELDFVVGGRLYTGERLLTRTGFHHVLSLEICRSLLFLQENHADNANILHLVDSHLIDQCYVKDDCITGECVFAALTFWRYLLVSDWMDREERLKNYLHLLMENRDGYGGWKNFPFYYTLFVLKETQLPEAREELSYALPACQSHLPNIVIGEPYRSRRMAVLKECISNIQPEPFTSWPLGI